MKDPYPLPAVDNLNVIKTHPWPVKEYASFTSKTIMRPSFSRPSMKGATSEKEWQSWLTAPSVFLFINVSFELWTGSVFHARKSSTHKITCIIVFEPEAALSFDLLWSRQLAIRPGINLTCALQPSMTGTSPKLTQENTTFGGQVLIGSL